MTHKKNTINSAVVIGRLLDAEGFTPHIAGECERFARRVVLTERQKKKYQRTKQAFKDIVNRMSEGDRAVIGRFVNFQKQFGFGSGLRVGLGAFAAKNETDIDLVDEYTEPPIDSDFIPETPAM